MNKKPPSFLWAADCLLLALLAAWLIWPQFKLKYSNKWDSIESTFIADARFLKDHWPHPRWQPLWYTGTRFDFIYPPGLRYGTAALARVFPILPVKAYHIFGGIFYCVAIAGVYFLIRVATGSRGWAWVGALASLLVSPSYLFLPKIRADAWLWVPWRLAVLTKYGEAPHMSALAVIPIALAFAFRALQVRRPAALALAALFSALAVSLNFYGATSLALLFAILLWSVWITHQDRAVFARAALIVALAYGLTAFWLVPSYFRVTLENLKYVSTPGTTWSLWLFLAVTIAYLLLSDRLARGKPHLAWTVFVLGSLALFALNVLGHAYFDFKVTGDPTRLIPELDLVMILAAIEGLRRLWRAPSRVLRAAAAVVVMASLATSVQYLRRHRDYFTTDPEWQRSIEYRIEDWMAKNLPGQRALVGGSVRFWYDVWHDLPHLGGGSEQGLENGIVMYPMWQMQWREDPRLSILWMQSMGVDAVVVHGPKSEERYHDFAYPNKFDGLLPVIYASGADDKVYRIPRRFPGIARVVDQRALEALRTPRDDRDIERVQAYAGVVEKGPDAPAAIAWQGTDAFQLSATLGPGQAVLVQEAYDPAWHAYAGSRRLAVRKDAMGFLEIQAPTGEQTIAVRFELPLENVIGRVLFAAALAGVAGLLILGRRQGEARVANL